MADDGKDEAIGYKRPPSHTRFRPGHSGNPSGRPKRKPTFRMALLEELAAIMPGNDPLRAGSKLQALVKTLVDTAIAGDARAQSLLIGALARMGDAEERKGDAEENEAASLTADDREILDAYMGSEVKGVASETDAASPLGDDHAD
jgi:uncharacterized protein DUF5681